MIDVEQHGSERADAATGVRRHPLERLVRCAPVGQSRQRIAGGAELGKCEVALVGQDRIGLHYRLGHPAAVALRDRVLPRISTEPITVPPTSSGSHATAPATFSTDFTHQQGLAVRSPLVGPAEAYRDARTGLHLLELEPAECCLLSADADDWLKAIIAVVAIEDRRCGASQDPLDVPDQQRLRLVL